jgi:hypothetical protein
VTPDVGIEVNRASVHTLSLSVQVMKLDKRQVTLAVFRQLDSASLLIPQGIPQGTPWGRVNYHVGCDPYGGKHLHMVWQKGDRLYRATVYRELHQEILRKGWEIAPAEEPLFNDRWTAAYDKLAAMDQLFIAI